MAARRSKKKPTNVISLRGTAIPLPTVNADCVQELERLVDLADSGFIAGFMWGVVSPEGHFETGWAGNGNANSMTAAANILAHRINTFLTETD